MVVIVDNNVIETQFIWKITPVIVSDMGRECTFSVHFLNAKTLVVCKRTIDEIPDLNYSKLIKERGLTTQNQGADLWKEILSNLKSKTESMHDRLVELWQANQTSIPKINYE